MKSGDIYRQREREPCIKHPFVMQKVNTCFACTKLTNIEQQQKSVIKLVVHPKIKYKKIGFEFVKNLCYFGVINCECRPRVQSFSCSLYLIQVDFPMLSEFERSAFQ